MNNMLFLAIIIPALIIFPTLIVDTAYAFKVTGTDIVVEVHFNKNDQTTPDIEALIDNLDSGTLETEMVNNMINADGSPIVGQFTTDNIEADWRLSINSFSGLHRIWWEPEIIEVNVKNGVNFGTINDLVIDGARPTITNYLQTYGVTDFTWFLHYDGGLLCEDSGGNPISCE